jgi:tetratricopeptide (TPR) repeat protein
MGNLKEALSDFEMITPSSDIYNRVSCAKAQIFLSLGIQNFNNAKYQAAEDTLTLSIREISICDELQFNMELKPEIWNVLGLLFSETRRYLDAINAFSKAIETNPEYPQYWYRRGYASHKLEEQILARRDLRTAIELDQEYADAHRLLFEICLKLMDFNESCKECGTLERLNIDDLNYPCRTRIQEKFGELCPN